MEDETFVKISGTRGTVITKIAARDSIGGKMTLGMKPGTTFEVEETKTNGLNTYIRFSSSEINGETVKLSQGILPEKLWVIAKGFPTGIRLASSPMPKSQALDIVNILEERVQDVIVNLEN